MGDHAWTDATWNPLAGCSLASPGCTHCYAMRWAHRLERQGISAYQGTTQVVNGQPVWTGRVSLNPQTLQQPLHWKRPRRIFVNSMSDLFHEAVPYDWIDAIWRVMAQCPQHIFQVLTKRAERLWHYLAQREPLPNVWVGVSAEDQRRLYQRRFWLMCTPAAVRFLSLEPLLGPMRLLHGYQWARGALRSDGRPPIDWVIIGGESGPRARPCEIAWIRSLIEQCQAFAIPAFVKQLGRYPVIPEPELDEGPFAPDWEWPMGTPFGNPTRDRTVNGRVALLRDPKGADPAEWPEDLRIRQFPGDLAYA